MLLCADFTDHPLPPEDRARASAFLRRSAASVDAHYARRLEQRIYSYHRSSKPAYMAHMRKLTHSLASNGAALLGVYTPDQLAQLDDAILAKGSPLEVWAEAYRARKREEEALLTSNESVIAEDEQARTQVEGIMVCTRCKSSDITWDQKQTRGADESMTVFFQCRNCAKRWKMS